MFLPGSNDKDTSILRCLPEDVLVEIVKQLDTKDALNIRLVEQFLGKSKKINDEIWKRLMQEEFGFPAELIAISEDKHLLYARLKYIFWRSNDVLSSYDVLCSELMTRIVDDHVAPHDLGWLLYTNPNLSQSYIDYLARLSPDEKFKMLKRAILARNEAVVDQLLGFTDLALNDIRLLNLGSLAAQSGDVNLVKKMMALANQHDYELNPQKSKQYLSMHDAALRSGSVEVVQYLYKLGKGEPSFTENCGVCSLEVLICCREYYQWTPSLREAVSCLKDGSVVLAQALIKICGQGLLENDSLPFVASMSGNIKLIDYLISLKPDFHISYEDVGRSGNAKTCLELLRRSADDGIDKIQEKFNHMYRAAVVTGKYNLIRALEDYYKKNLYPAVMQSEHAKSADSLPQHQLDLLRDPINMLIGESEAECAYLLREISHKSYHISERLILRVLCAVPESYQFEPGMIQNLAICADSETVLDYLMDRWPGFFTADVFRFTYNKLVDGPKFSLVKYLIEVKGILPGEEAIGPLKDKFGDEAEQYFARTAVHKPV